MRRSQAGTTEVGTYEKGMAKIGTDEDGTVEIGIAEFGTGEVGTHEVGMAEVRIAEGGSSEIGPSEVYLYTRVLCSPLLPRLHALFEKSIELLLVCHHTLPSFPN